MSTLKLILKRKWFDMIADGIKMEEYREIKPYYLHRLFEDWKGNKIDEKYINNSRFFNKFKKQINNLKNGQLSVFKYKHDGVMFYHGYATDRDKMYCNIESITIGEGNPEWGAEPGKEYFVIRLKKD